VEAPLSVLDAMELDATTASPTTMVVAAEHTMSVAAEHLAIIICIPRLPATWWMQI